MVLKQEMFPSVHPSKSVVTAFHAAECLDNVKQKATMKDWQSQVDEKSKCIA